MHPEPAIVAAILFTALMALASLTCYLACAILAPSVRKS